MELPIHSKWRVPIASGVIGALSAVVAIGFLPPLLSDPPNERGDPKLSADRSPGRERSHSDQPIGDPHPGTSDDMVPPLLASTLHGRIEAALANADYCREEAGRELAAFLDTSDLDTGDWHSSAVDGLSSYSTLLTLLELAEDPVLSRLFRQVVESEFTDGGGPFLSELHSLGIRAVETPDQGFPAILESLQEGRDIAADALSGSQFQDLPPSLIKLLYDRTRIETLSALFVDYTELHGLEQTIFPPRSL